MPHPILKEFEIKNDPIFDRLYITLQAKEGVIPAEADGDATVRRFRTFSFKTVLLNDPTVIHRFDGPEPNGD